jgi:hypothetical protein
MAAIDPIETFPAVGESLANPYCTLLIDFAE